MPIGHNEDRVKESRSLTLPDKLSGNLRKFSTAKLAPFELTSLVLFVSGSGPPCHCRHNVPLVDGALTYSRCLIEKIKYNNSRAHY